jgi:hypothetical protein
LQNVVLQNHHSLDKMVQPWTELGCGDGDPSYSCRMPGKGFPSGMCTTSCEHIREPREICAATAGDGFGDCISGGGAFDECLEKHQQAASRGRCNDQLSCRNDYICAKVPGSTDGACVPAYFLFQVRVDGHPVPAID